MRGSLKETERLDTGQTQVLALKQASGGQRKPASAALGEGQWGRLDRLVDMSMTHRVFARQVDGQSGGWGSIQARTPRREACPLEASRPAPVSEAMQGEVGVGRW